MSKVKVFFIISMVVLFAAVALISGVAQVPFLSAGKANLPSAQHQNTGILTADGGDPQPKPSPLPWRLFAA